MIGRRGIDHLVLPVQDMETARDTYTRLGFTLTPAAQHPFGTDNSLAQLDGCFLELLSVERPGDIPDAAPTAFSFPAFNNGFLSRREGLSMLVFESGDAEADRKELAAAGLQTWDPFTFQRTARLPGGDEVTVGFSLTFVTGPAMPEAAFFTCEQWAPEYFWKPDYQRHPNGAKTVLEVVMVADDPARAAPFFAGLQGQGAVHRTGACLRVDTPRGCVSVVPPAVLADRFGCEPPGDPAAPHFAGYLVEVPDVAAVSAYLRDGGIPGAATDECLLVRPKHGHGCFVGFVEPDPGAGSGDAG